MQGKLRDYKECVFQRVKDLINAYVPVQRKLQILITFDLNDATIKWKGEPHSKLDGEQTIHKAEMENKWEYRRERKTNV